MLRLGLVSSWAGQHAVAPPLAVLRHFPPKRWARSCGARNSRPLARPLGLRRPLGLKFGGGVDDFASAPPGGASARQAEPWRLELVTGDLHRCTRALTNRRGADHCARANGRSRGGWCQAASPQLCEAQGEGRGNSLRRGFNATTHWYCGASAGHGGGPFAFKSTQPAHALELRHALSSLSPAVG